MWFEATELFSVDVTAPTEAKAMEEAELIGCEHHRQVAQCGRYEICEAAAISEEDFDPPDLPARDHEPTKQRSLTLLR